MDTLRGLSYGTSQINRPSVEGPIAQSIARVRLLDHPFYQAWSRGTLTREDLQFYAGQYYHVVRAFPEMIAQVAAHIPEGPARRALEENLADELGASGPSHPSLWLDFAQGIGAPRGATESAPATPETLQALASLSALSKGAGPAAIAALWAIESQAPDVSAAKIRGLRDFYGVHDASTLAYFNVHSTLDVEHSDEEMAILGSMIQTPNDSAAACDAALVAAHALWRVLDGVVRERHISCAPGMPSVAG
ncbi:MAG: iron-containing redox enzyme family protein [Thermoplasmatota archaeon]